jgi:hypothetical protein
MTIRFIKQFVRVRVLRTHLDIAPKLAKERSAAVCGREGTSRRNVRILSSPRARYERRCCDWFHQRGAQPRSRIMRGCARIALSTLLTCLSARLALAQSPVSLTIDTRSPGLAISPDFGVFSFETSSLHYGSKAYNPNGYFFNATNTQLITLFHNLGVKSLRIGGDSVDGTYLPTTNDIAAFFGFVKASGVKVIYSLNLAHGEPLQDASTASYLWQNYRTNIICLAIGNEPNEYKVNGQNHSITNFSTFFADWKSFASAITTAVPDVELGGPDNDGAAVSWASRFASRERDNANLPCILYHFKPLKGAKGKTDQELIAGELSPGLDATNYPSCYQRIGVMAQSSGFSYRFSEFNDWVAPRKTGLTDYSFAAALFALDALHWWAAHDCRGVYFHTGIHGFHADFFVDSNGNYQLYPIGYGIAAFSLGGYGNAEPLTMSNPNRLNLTAYAVRNGANLYVTIINKEFGKTPRSAAVTITPDGFLAGSASVMFLVQANGDVTATQGVTLGEASISGAGPWPGQWRPLAPVADGHCAITVPASCAVVVKMAPPRNVQPEAGRRRRDNESPISLNL